MKKLVSIVTFFAVLVVGAAAVAANSAFHTVTVDVQAINEVSITGGNVTLLINSATAGAEPDSDSDIATSLNWTTNEASKKISVATSVTSPKYDLQVVAANISGGTATAAVTITNVAQDFVTGIATTTGSATLSYSATATASDGTGPEEHTITYTITTGS